MSKNNMKGRQYKKGITYCVIVIVIGGIIGGLWYMKSVDDYQSAVKSMAYSEVDFSKILDGVYEGVSDVEFIKARVAVTVNDAKIEKIELIEHTNERGEKAEKIINAIVAQQKIDVDTISGATNSSKVIKKAVENALTHQGINK